MKNKKILKIVFPIILLIAILISVYFIDTHMFYAKHKDYNSESQIKVTYLIVDKDVVPENTSISDALRKYKNGELFSLNQVVPLQKNGNYYYANLSDFTNSVLLEDTSDNVFTMHNVRGEVINDCEYDKNTKTIKVPISYYENKTQDIPIQFELESRMTKKQFKNTKINLNVKNIITKKKKITVNSTNKKLNKDNIEIYVNNSNKKVDKKFFDYDSKTNLVTLSTPGVLINNIDVKISKNIISKASALGPEDYSSWNAITLNRKPTGFSGGYDFTITRNSGNFYYCDNNCSNVPSDIYDYQYTYNSDGQRYAYSIENYPFGIFLGALDNHDEEFGFYFPHIYISLICAEHHSAAYDYNDLDLKVSVFYATNDYIILRVRTEPYQTQTAEAFLKLVWPEEQTTSLKVKKNLVGATATDALNGFGFKLYSDNTCQTQVSGTTEQFTNNEGIVTFDNLPMATSYWIKETTFDSSKWIPEQPNCKQVQTESVGTVSNTFTNTRNRYCLKIRKKDAESGAVLSGFTFNLNKGGQTLKTETTGNDGTITFSNLEYGDYTVTETGAPDNYCINGTTSGSQTFSASELTPMEGSSCAANTITKEVSNYKKYYCAKVKKYDYDTKELITGASFKINGTDTEHADNWDGRNDGYTTFYTGTSTAQLTVLETVAPSGYEKYSGTLNATPVQMRCGLTSAQAETECKNIVCTYNASTNTDTCTYSNGEAIPGLNTQTMPAYPEKKNLLNWYKVTENGSTRANGAKFKVKQKSGNQYIKVNGTQSVKDGAGVTKTCYVFDSLVSENEASTLSSMNTGSADGEVCISKLVKGEYTVIETNPVKYHTFSSESTKNISTSTEYATMANGNKFINKPTSFEFTKAVTSGDSEEYQNLTTEALKKIAFNIYDSNNNKLSFIKDSNGVYQYADNNIDPPQGTRVTDLFLNDNRKFKVEHLPEGTYSVKEKGSTSGDTCVCEDGSDCIGFYHPEYTNESDYKFTISDCSNPDASSTACTTSKTVTKTLINKPTEITFTKADLYGYEDASDIVDFENDQERNDFDRITFKVKDANGNYLKFLKVGNHGTCKTDDSYSIYRYIPESMISSLTADQRAALTDTLNTCGGHIHITHLCRGKKYFIEETSVPENSVFTLPENVEDRTREYNIHCCEGDTTPSSKTAIINDKPTRVRFEKRDSKYNYLIPDETTTFKVYQCKNGVECHPADGENSDMKLMKFSARSVIRNDEEDPTDAEGLAGVEVYRAMSDSDVQSGQNFVTELHPYHGLLVLRYLPSGYQYVLLETVAPKNYSLPKGRDAETRFTVVNNTVQVDEVDMPNVPTSLLIRKYSDEGNLLPGAQFKVYQGTTCDPNLSPMNQPKVGLKLKTIRDGLYEYRPELDTDIIQTCSDANGTCSSIPVNALTKLTYTDYLGTFADFDNVTNDENEKIEIQQGEALIQYLEYGHCYIIEEVKAPNGYSLPKNPEDRFTMINIAENESYAQDTYKTLVNSPTPFTFYKFDEYNQLSDGAEFKLQKLDNDKKYQDITVTKEEKNGEFYYKADPNSTEKTITTKNGKATVYYLPAGQYRILETKPLPGKELGKNQNVATFFVDDSGNVYGNSIIVNKGKTDKIEIKSSSSAEFIIGPRTGTTVIKYGIIIAALVALIAGLMILRKKMK